MSPIGIRNRVPRSRGFEGGLRPVPVGGNELHDIQGMVAQTAPDIVEMIDPSNQSVFEVVQRPDCDIC